MNLRHSTKDPGDISVYHSLPTHTAFPELRTGDLATALRSAVSAVPEAHRARFRTELWNHLRGTVLRANTLGWGIAGYVVGSAGESGVDAGVDLIGRVPFMGAIHEEAVELSGRFTVENLGLALGSALASVIVLLNALAYRRRRAILRSELHRFLGEFLRSLQAEAGSPAPEKVF